MNQNIEKLSVIKSYEVKGVLTADLLSNSIVEVKWNTSLKTIEKIHIIELTQAIKILGDGKQMRIYVNTHDFISIDQEARRYSTTEEACRYTLASAVQIDNLGQKLIFNFYMNFNKPSLIIKGFSSRTSAFDWLLSI